jgi:hypothetical protein
MPVLTDATDYNRTQP